MAHLSVSLLGDFQVHIGNQRVDNFESVKVRALLAYLVVEADKAHRREQLAGFLWPDSPEARARRNLSQTLYNLRLQLGDKKRKEQSTLENQASVSPFLLVQPDTIQLNPKGNTWLDVADFSRLLADSKSHNHQRLEECSRCLSKLEKATALYRGEFFEGFSLKECYHFNEWTLLHRERLRRLVGSVIDNLVACRARRGELDQALTYAWRLVEFEPLWEHAQRQLIDLLARVGQIPAALEQFKTFQQLQLDELGLPPEAETLSLLNRIRTEKKSRSSQSNFIHNLPATLTPFVGRKEELARLNASLEDPDCRLVTITGPGGSGKTRLALEVARAQTARFPHGVWRIPLAPLQSANGIPAAIAKSLGLSLKEQPTTVQQLKDYLRAKSLLLVLDGYEHILEGAGYTVDLLKESPDVKILATSRIWLNVYGEQVFPIRGMVLPHKHASLEIARQNEAVALFVAAGKRVRPNFDLSSHNLKQVIHVCRLVGGNPLGLLLAAAWLDTLSAKEVAYEIGRSLDFLSARWKDFPARQRSIRATFDYSWKLLAIEEQEVLSRLAVFQGGFNLPAARHVARASRRNLRALVAKSMIERRLTGRFVLHDLVRQFAAEKLVEKSGRGSSVKDLHTEYYLNKLPDWAESLKGPGQVDILEEMDVEIGNLVAAWGWAAKRGQVESIDQSLEGLCLYYDLRARLQEGQTACQVVLDHLPTDSHHSSSHLRWKTNAWKAHFLNEAGQHEKTGELLRKELAALEYLDSSDPDTPAAKAQLQLELGYAMLPADRPAARQHFQNSLSLYESLGDAWWQVRALVGLGTVAHHSGTFEEAVQYYQRSLALLETHGDPKSIAGVRIELGHNLLRQGLLEEGDARIRLGCEIYQEIGDRASLSTSLLQLSRVYFWYGEFTKIPPLIDEMRPVFEELGRIEDVAFNAVGMGLILGLMGEFEGALQYGQEGMALAQENGFQRFQALAYWVQGVARLGLNEYRMAEEHLEESVALYRAIDQRDELGWALATLGYAKLELDSEAVFRKTLCEALRLGLDIKGLFTILLSLPAAALYFLEQRRTSKEGAAAPSILRAVELYTLARKYPSSGNAQFFEDVAGKRILAAAVGLPPVEVQAAHERARVQDPFTVAHELLSEWEASSK